MWKCCVGLIGMLLEDPPCSLHQPTRTWTSANGSSNGRGRAHRLDVSPSNSIIGDQQYITIMSTDDRGAFDMRLPPIQMRPDKNTRGRAASSFDFHNSEGEKYSDQLIPMGDLTDASKYEQMTEKELIKEHELLVRRLLKYRQLIDIILFKSPRPKKDKPKPTNSTEIIQKQMQNNVKIISNHLNQIKQIEKVKKQRPIEQIMNQETAIKNQISALKRDIFSLKNQDVMNSRNLLTDREVFEKERHELDMAYKMEIKKTADYKKKYEELQAMVESLKGKHVGEPPKSPNGRLKQKYSDRKEYYDALKSQVQSKDELLEEYFNAKTRRNHGIIKQTEVVEKKCKQLEKQIEEFRSRNDRYWRKEQ